LFRSLFFSQRCNIRFSQNTASIKNPDNDYGFFPCLEIDCGRVVRKRCPYRAYGAEILGSNPSRF
jgi:hypothetical protein